MKIQKFIKIIIVFLLSIINIYHSEITFKEFSEMVEEQLGSSTNFDVDPKSLVFFKIIPRKTKAERRKLDYLAGILKIFLENMNIHSNVFNIENRHFVAIIKRSIEIDSEIILSQFSDLISEMNVLPPDVFKKKDEDSTIDI
jgi:hypothetical protein